MTAYVEKSLSKGERAASAAEEVLTMKTGESRKMELKHGAWIERARATMSVRRFGTPLFALIVIFAVLFVGSVYLFEHMDIISPPLYATKVVLTSLFAVTLGFLLSIWWGTAAKMEEKIREVERIDVEYRELLMSFSDSLFDIINALNTLAEKPPRPFVIATEFMLGEYVHLLQSRLQYYGDYVAGLGFDATDFLDEKIRIFEGIRERASLSIKDMPKELETLFVGSLNLDSEKYVDVATHRQAKLKAKLKELDEANQAKSGKTPSAQRA